MTKDNKDLIKIAVKDFNNSSWVDLGQPYDIISVMERADEVGVYVVLNEIRREDIRLFHKEEALCGNI